MRRSFGARPVIALATFVMLVLASPAHAGRTHFAWLYGTDIVPERGTEIETWILEENEEGPDKTRETAFWWGPVFAPTQHLELAILGEAAFEDERDGKAGIHFTRWGAEVRYRLQSPDLVDAGPFATKLRFGAKRLIEDRAGYQLEADVIASLTMGRFHAAIDLGGVAEMFPGNSEQQFRPGAGACVRVTRDLRIGAEMYGELVISGPGTSWLVVGPSVALTSGRIWVAAAYGIGVFGIRDAPRITFGVAL
jgi:hypothetical protein